MIKKQTIYIILFSLTVGMVLSYKYTEYNDQGKKLIENYQVVPVPIPGQLTFADEKVPLDRFEIKERLDRELLVNTYWQSNSLLILKRSKKNFEIIEPILAKYGVPSDFKYLAVAESGLL
ncbi:MAG: lytic transglycosylase domain-containing protein, partial [Bacteroidia bacterium]|nr:lytic transglycosylase domain-containing protein [Bacteroidia bacterium]